MNLVAEQPLEDRAAGVQLGLAVMVAVDRIGEHVDGPSVQAALDDAEGRFQGAHQLVGAGP